MRGTWGIIAVAVTAIVVSGCAGSPQTKAAPMAQPSFRIVEHKNSTLGGDIPDWTSKDVGELESDSRFDGKLVFRIEETGKDLSGVRALVDNMDAPSEVARMISTRVEQVFAGAQAGDEDFVETYFENVVKTISRTEINGLRKYGDFWVLKEYLRDDGSSGDREYVYYTLYTIDKTIVDDLVQRAIDDTGGDTAEEQTARDRVRQVLEGEF